MIWLVIVLAVLAVALAVVAIVTGRRLRAERARATGAEERAARHERELAEVTAARDTAERERADATTRAEAAEARVGDLDAEVTELTARTAEAEQRAVAADAARDDARRGAEEAAAARLEAETQLAAMQQRMEEAAAQQAAAEQATAAVVASAPAATGELDAQVVWALERARSERTWRQSVAVSPDGSAFADAAHPLAVALQIELDAAREEVGAVGELDAQLPSGITAAGSVLALKAAQELLADVVRQSETTTLRVRGDGADLIVEVDARDEDGNRVEAGPLPTPQSPLLEPTANGVRIRHAVAVAAD